MSSSRVLRGRARRWIACAAVSLGLGAVSILAAPASPYGYAQADPGGQGEQERAIPAASTSLPDGGVAVAKDCGVFCTGIALGLLELDRPNLDVLRRETSTVDGVCSLAGVASSLTSRGVACTAIEDPEALESVAIVPMARYGDESIVHFVVVQPVRGDQVLLYDPPLSVESSQWSVVRPEARGPVLLCERRGSQVRWWYLLGGGLLLAGWLVRRSVVRRHPGCAALALAVALLPTSAGCSAADDHRIEEVVRLEPGPYTDLGTRPAGTVAVDLCLVNGSDLPFGIDDVNASCSCTDLRMDDRSAVPPGEERAIHVEIRVRPKARETVVVTVVGTTGDLIRTTMVVQGEMDPGVRLPGPASLGEIPVRGVTRHQLRLEMTKDAADRLGVTRGPEPQWRIVSGGRACQIGEPEDGGSSIRTLPGGGVAMVSQLEIRPDVSGPGGAGVLLAWGDHQWHFEAGWHATHARALRPEIPIFAADSHDSSVLRATVTIDARDGDHRLGVQSAPSFLDVTVSPRLDIRSALVGWTASVSGARDAIQAAGSLDVVLQIDGAGAEPALVHLPLASTIGDQ